MNKRYAALAKDCEKLQVSMKQDALLKNYTSFKIGGPCALLLAPENVTQLRQVIPLCRSYSLPYLVLGNGSNLLVSDAGYDGVVITTANLKEKLLQSEDVICCGAGLPLSSLCHFALDHALSGLEFAYGIPGSVGGAAYMNAGAYGGEMKDVIRACTHVDALGEINCFSPNELDFSYRHSVYQNNHFCITKVCVKLTPGDPKEIKRKMDDFYGRRKAKQPLQYPSAGSTFKRPEGSYASALIDQCGLKGAQIGGAQVSEKHAGFLINTGNATCRDMESLIVMVQKKVLEQTGISLECEVKKIGI